MGIGRIVRLDVANATPWPSKPRNGPYTKKKYHHHDLHHRRQQQPPIDPSTDSGHSPVVLGPHAHEGALVLEHSALEPPAQDLLDLPGAGLSPLLLLGHLHQDVLLRHLPALAFP